ncbi:MAG: hypothetical protein CVV24_12765 [Ignavibacteriae bacterium HGW-Ignavibacteriae-3]|nr:MAG: hypothetical protein CVV24_12765 [Ignavibacteriae bacterium HGW-Ignavibacteriae-3]
MNSERKLMRATLGIFRLTTFQFEEIRVIGIFKYLICESNSVYFNPSALEIIPKFKNETGMELLNNFLILGK